ncbi:PREDICTED: alpha-2,8-sialyltransferase 8B-like [Branchiostoma belcheri]|uniref:Alpha-2,8-sialyltransferase 8B-like n=1 Tax=Branchiostoma belcheri TaxID=7741 RepID=A0A6P4Y4E2_BRABE|nr:PREDICTED: alpha-2,8-sialyltransferase 8B-like [Branchiostoma belcheri]
MFIIGLVFFATIHFLLQGSPKLEVQTNVKPPGPRYIHRKDTTRVQSDSTPASRTARPATFSTPPVSVAPSDSWTFNAEEIRKVRNATAMLHPNARLRTHKLGIWPCQKKRRRRRNSCRPAPFKHNVSLQTTCAIVGNGGILLGSHCGSEINSKDYIIRMHLSAIRGFERDVGRKTNMTILNVSTPRRIKSSSGLENRTQDVYESRMIDINGTVLVSTARDKFLLKLALKKYQNLSFVLLTSKDSFRDESLIHRVASDVAWNNGTKPRGPPSTGLATVLTATTFCDQLHLYGFFPFKQDKNKKPLPYHYYPGDFIEPVIQERKHKMGKEYRFYKELQQRGVLKLHIGKCDEK